ncbi:hypothetical protein GIB67_029709 [Kingdonia uniflora]|uniref:Uncharacterized protein n=1 Tax=Kingdonia uniflora TaxID=39325 RepID=A0A7J7LLX4_9MAGN|nr:hypothetical protein GIB67_029709 [Kingdonia uniflora]
MEVESSPSPNLISSRLIFTIFAFSISLCHHGHPNFRLGKLIGLGSRGKCCF